MWYRDVSIHAPLTGGDLKRVFDQIEQQGFQSTPPSREATLRYRRVYVVPRCFNPRPPHGRRPVTGDRILIIS